MAGILILVVEDTDRNMTLLRDVLRASGYRTLEASTGGQALALAAEHGPALVLMDIRLPDMDGLEALRRLRLAERTAATPVLAVTAQAMHGDRERFEEAGFDGYLSKPVDIDELLAAVERHSRPT
jgi:two-component system cell cycle response regulator DivK